MTAFIVSVILSIYAKQYQITAISALFLCYVIWSHFKQSSVSLASQFFKDKDYEKALKYLDEVPNPDRLSRGRRGYYEFMKGTIALKEEDFEAAEFHFQVASRFPVGGKNQKAYVLIHLANLALRKKDGNRAMTYVEKAKEIAESARAKEILTKIEEEALKLAN
jgi:tetratricopeptide (TPR) repeat protein